MTLNIHDVLKKLTGNATRTQEIEKRITAEMERASEEGRPSELLNLLARANAAMNAPFDSPKRMHYQSASRGTFYFPTDDKELLDFLQKNYAADIIDLQSLAGDSSLVRLMTHCNAYMHGTESPSGLIFSPAARANRQAIAKEIFAHIAPVVAKRQPQVLLKFTRLLIDHGEDEPSITTLENAHQLMETAIRRDPHGIKKQVLPQYRAESRAREEAEAAGDTKRAAMHAANAEFLYDMIGLANTINPLAEPVSEGRGR